MIIDHINKIQSSSLLTKNNTNPLKKYRTRITKNSS
jgi:hypothetical protein